MAQMLTRHGRTAIQNRGRVSDSFLAKRAAGKHVGASNMTNNPNLRFIEVSAHGLETVRSLAREIWPVVYRDLLSAEQISYMLAWMYSPARLREDLKKGVTFILIRDGKNDEDFGFCAFGPVERGGSCFIHKVYVAPAHHRRGAGTAALAEIEKRARFAGASGLSLRVNRHNAPAIALYRKCRMEITGTDCADIGGGFVMDDFIFEKRF